MNHMENRGGMNLTKLLLCFSVGYASSLFSTNGYEALKLISSATGLRNKYFITTTEDEKLELVNFIRDKYRLYISARIQAVIQLISEEKDFKSMKYIFDDILIYLKHVSSLEPNSWNSWDVREHILCLYGDFILGFNIENLLVQNKMKYNKSKSQYLCIGTILEKENLLFNYKDINIYADSQDTTMIDFIRNDWVTYYGNVFYNTLALEETPINPKIRYSGIYNSTSYMCYCNAFVQALFSVDIIRKVVFNSKEDSSKPLKNAFILAFRMLENTTDGSPVDVGFLMETFIEMGIPNEGGQNDSDVMFRFVVDNFEELKGIFNLTFIQKMKCKGKVIYRFNEADSLIIASRNTKCNLQDYINDHFADKNVLFRGNDGIEREYEETDYIFTSPLVLVVLLNRFTVKYKFDKKKEYEVPEILKVDGRIYQLNAFTDYQYFSNNASSGHYTCWARSRNSRGWLHFNDTHVTKYHTYAEERLRKHGAHLFYIRVSDINNIKTSNNTSDSDYSEWGNNLQYLNNNYPQNTSKNRRNAQNTTFTETTRTKNQNKSQKNTEDDNKNVLKNFNQESDNKSERHLPRNKNSRHPHNGNFEKGIGNDRKNEPLPQNIDIDIKNELFAPQNRKKEPHARNKNTPSKGYANNDRHKTPNIRKENGFFKKPTNSSSKNHKKYSSPKKKFSLFRYLFGCFFPVNNL